MSFRYVDQHDPSSLNTASASSSATFALAQNDDNTADLTADLKKYSHCLCFPVRPTTKFIGWVALMYFVIKLWLTLFFAADTSHDAATQLEAHYFGYEFVPFIKNRLLATLVVYLFLITIQAIFLYGVHCTRAHYMLPFFLLQLIMTVTIVYECVQTIYTQQNLFTGTVDAADIAGVNSGGGGSASATAPTAAIIPTTAPVITSPPPVPPLPPLLLSTSSPPTLPHTTPISSVVVVSTVAAAAAAADITTVSNTILDNATASWMALIYPYVISIPTKLYILLIVWRCYHYLRLKKQLLEPTYLYRSQSETNQLGGIMNDHHHYHHASHHSQSQPSSAQHIPSSLIHHAQIPPPPHSATSLRRHTATSMDGHPHGIGGGGGIGSSRMLNGDDDDDDDDLGALSSSYPSHHYTISMHQPISY